MSCILLSVGGGAHRQSYLGDRHVQSPIGTSATASEMPAPVSEFGIVRIGESYLFFVSARNLCLNSFVAKPDDREIPASDGGVAGC